LWCIHREFSYKSLGERILKIGPHLPKLLSNIKWLKYFFGTQYILSHTAYRITLGSVVKNCRRRRDGRKNLWCRVDLKLKVGSSRVESFWFKVVDLSRLPSHFRVEYSIVGYELTKVTPRSKCIPSCKLDLNTVLLRLRLLLLLLLLLYNNKL